LVRQITTCLRDICELEAFPCRTPAEREVQRRRLVQEMRRRGTGAHVFGLYTGDETFWLLTYRGAMATQPPTVAGDGDGAFLDVSILHNLLLEQALGIDIHEDAIAFTQDDAAAVDLVARQDYQVAFLLNPTGVEQIVQPAMTGKRMPRKSTYFYPKLLTGIVMHKEVGDADYGG
jgi:uncharacterized protein (DUF1015 family)